GLIANRFSLGVAYPWTFPFTISKRSSVIPSLPKAVALSQPGVWTFLSRLSPSVWSRLNQLRLSGRDRALLPHPPLRTVRASFPAYGSSLCKASYDRSRQFTFISAMDLSVAVRMQNYQVRHCVRSALSFRKDVMEMPSRFPRDVLAAVRAFAVLYPPKVKQPPSSFQVVFHGQA